MIQTRLWHKDLIPVLPRQQLLGQWRECCAIAKSIAEKGTPNHVLVNRIMEYHEGHFWRYSNRIYHQMQARGYRANWFNFVKAMGKDWRCADVYGNELFHDWHNDRYLAQCLANLQEKHDCGAIPEEEWKKITDRYPEWK